jgi:hypothetical protein
MRLSLLRILHVDHEYCLGKGKRKWVMSQLAGFGWIKRNTLIDLLNQREGKEDILLSKPDAKSCTINLYQYKILPFPHSTCLFFSLHLGPTAH